MYSESDLEQEEPGVPESSSQLPVSPSVRHREERVAHWDRLAGRDKPSPGGRYYYRRLEQVYRFLIPPGQRVLELGSGTGRLLAALQPSHGVGVDFSAAAVDQARFRFPELSFVHADAHDFEADAEYDFIVLSDLINDLWDVQTVFERVAAIARPDTRIVINSYSRLWQVPLTLARGLRLATPVLEQNWLTVHDIDNLFRLTGLELLHCRDEVLWPLPFSPVGAFCDRFLVKLWPFRHLAVTHFLTARAEASPAVVGPPRSPQGDAAGAEPVVSVIVPARNEAGNVDEIFRRTPEIGGGTELVFVEGHSSDDTYAAIERGLAAHPERRAKLMRQTGEGKGDAVRLGFAESEGEVLMILDADLTVPPEDLPRFYQALASGRGEYINGVRVF